MEFKKIIEMLEDNDSTVMALAIKCKNAEKLITLAKEKGITISVEEAEVILKLPLEIIENLC